MSDDPEESAYYLRLVSMYMDIVTETVLRVFENLSPGKDAETFLKANLHAIIQLRTKHILNEEECKSLLQTDKSTHILKDPLDLNCFDVSLLITLARNLFTYHQLPPPAKGWKHPPKNKDKSLAADLLRLKITRNVIVGHSPRARLPKWRFEDEWQNVSEVVIRLQKHIDPGNAVHIKEKIDKYRAQSLDPSVENKFDEKIKEWHKEVTRIQDKVEELIKNLEGFDAYFKRKDDRFERYTKLLFKGGRFVLSAFLSKKTEGRDLQRIIGENKDALKKNITDSKHLNILYPPTNNTDPLDTSSWDVSLLATVILLLFVSTKDRGMKRNIKRIGDARKTYADAALVALDSNTFEDYWTDLKASIEIVSYELDEEKADQCYEILEECKKKISEYDFQTYMDELKKQGSEMKTFTDVYKDTLQKTKSFLQDMITHGINFKNSHDLELKMITLGKDEEKKEMAENILTEVWHEALDRSIQSSDFPEVKKEVLKILEEIKKSKSIKNITVKTSCILLQITCTLPNDMLNMLNYFESKRCQKSFGNISRELGYYVDSVLAVYHVVTIDCLWDISNKKGDSTQPEERAIRIPITMSSPAGMKHLISLCDSKEIANSTNSIADALSKHLDDTLELKTSTNINELGNVFDADTSSSDSCSDCSATESSGITSNQMYHSEECTEGMSAGHIPQESIGQLLEIKKKHCQPPKMPAEHEKPYYKEETTKRNRWSSGNLEEFLTFHPTERPAWREATITGDVNSIPSISEMIKDIVEYEKTYEKLKTTIKKSERKQIFRSLLTTFLCNVQKEEGIGVKEEDKTEEIMHILDNEYKTDEAWANMSFSDISEEEKQHVEDERSVSPEFDTYPSLEEELGDVHVRISCSGGAKPSKCELETKNLYKAYKHITSELNESNKETYSYSADSFTAEDCKGFIDLDALIIDTHRILMEDVMKKNQIPGRFSTNVRKANFKEYRHPTFDDEMFAEEAVMTLVDKVNDITDHIKRKNVSDEERALLYFKCSSLFLFVFLTLHPFADGNGRLARLLTSNNLRTFSPFMTPIYNVFSSSRECDYVQALVDTREGLQIPQKITAKDEAVRLTISVMRQKPCDLCSMLIESNWTIWRQLLVKLGDNSIKLFEWEIQNQQFLSRTFDEATGSVQ